MRVPGTRHAENRMPSRCWEMESRALFAGRPKVETQIEISKSGTDDVPVGRMLRFFSGVRSTRLGDDSVRARLPRGLNAARQDRTLPAPSAVRRDRCSEAKPAKSATKEQRSCRNGRLSVI